MPTQFPPSRDPDVPGTGPAASVPLPAVPVPPSDVAFRAPRRGDIVRHVHDPEGHEAQILRVTGQTNPSYVLRPYGPNSSHIRGVWYASSFNVVKLLGPEDTALLPSAPLSEGMTGLYPSREFAEQLADWYMSVRAGNHSTAEIPGWARVAARPVMRPTDAVYAIKMFLSMPYTHIGIDLNVSDGFHELGRMSNTATREEIVTCMLRGLIDIMNHEDGSVVRCMACAEAGFDRPEGSPECQTTHYACTVCGISRATPRCATCAELHANLVGTVPEEYVICASCCSHITVKDEDYEETMLKHTQCSTCKRGPKGCKCPGCEVAGCLNKLVRPCCGGCAAHCQCLTMCMRHTGMKRLVKFPAPAGEKGMTRLLGTEIETYGSAIRQYSPLLRKAVAAWQASVITDGSIGGTGVELVTQPAGGSQWRQMIADLGAGFKESQSITLDTCGLHMHADCTDVDAFALRRVIQLYAHIEFCLYDALPYERQTGQYSKPNGQKLLAWLANDHAKFDAKMEAGEAKRRLSYIQYGQRDLWNLPKLGELFYDARLARDVTVTETTIKTITSRWDEVVAQKIRHKSDPNRYHGLNMHSYWLRGTLEFRHHHGTNDPEKITNWGFVIGSIVDYCVKHADEDMPMILALEPRLAMEVILDGQPDVMKWLQTRWDKFTSKHKTRLSPQPARDPATGEV